jgi:uncharacterized protein (TIGR02646 family)
MKHSPKRTEPPCLSDWRGLANEDWQPTWENFGGKPKEQTKVALLKEQGWVCAYCGRGVDADGSHIDHFWPQHLFKIRELDYDNFFVSCGPSGVRGAPRICGDAKDDWIPTDARLIPSDPTCEGRFKYSGSGAIKAANDQDEAADATITALNLDDASLQLERKQIIFGIESAILDGEITKDNKAAEISHLRAPDAQGRCKSFGHVMARYLEDEPL